MREIVFWACATVYDKILGEDRYITTEVNPEDKTKFREADR